MISFKAKNRLKTSLEALVEGVLAEKKDQIDFMIGLNLLDDVLADLNRGREIADKLAIFIGRHRYWIQSDFLNGNQKERLSRILMPLCHALQTHDDPDNVKLREELGEWLRFLGHKSFKLILKSPGEEISLSSRFSLLLKRETEELDSLLSRHDHLMTCLDDLLKSAECKEDKLYQHLSASLIYFLKREGYKVDPYVKRLRQTQEKRTENRT